VISSDCMHNHLKRLIDFSRKTGDRLIITDDNGLDPIVILSFSEYEMLRGVGGGVVAKKNGGLSSVDVVNDISGVDDAGFDDLALDMSVGSGDVVGDIDSGHAAVGVDRKKLEKTEDLDVNDGDKAQVLAKNGDDTDLPDEEQFYLEPS